MHCRSIPLPVLPHQPQLLRDYLLSFEKVSGFYQHAPTLDSLLRVAKELQFPAGRRRDVAAILRQQNQSLGSGSATLANLERFANGAAVIVSGQQVGLFGGPAYSVYKALAAVRVAADLTAQGVEAVPVFWMATEDHDLDEVRKALFFHEGQLREFALPAGAGGGAPVGQIALGAEVEDVAQAAGQILGANHELATLLRETYTPLETYGSAFGKLFARLLVRYGIILMDPLDPRLHRLAEPLFAKAVEDRDALDQALLERGKALESAGYPAQVKVTAKSTVLFHISKRGRQAITVSGNGAGAKFEAGEAIWTRDELLQAIHREPENFSPNALFRPVTQDYLLPTIGYVGGPAEISYFAQSEVLYRAVLGRMPVMLPRPGFTLVDTKAQRLLAQYGLDVEDVWAGAQELAKKLNRASVPEDLSRTLDSGATAIAGILAEWQQAVAKLDPSLNRAVETAQKKIAYQTAKLRERIGRALKNKEGVLAAHEVFLSNLLYPNKTLQSRQLDFLPFAARWGADAFEEISRHSGVKSIGAHYIIPVP